jgi:hypothetical protein
VCEFVRFTELVLEFKGDSRSYISKTGVSKVEGAHFNVFAVLPWILATLLLQNSLSGCHESQIHLLIFKNP